MAFQTDLCCQISLDHSRARASIQQAVLSLTAEILPEDCNISWAWDLLSPGETLQAARWAFMSALSSSPGTQGLLLSTGGQA